MNIYKNFRIWRSKKILELSQNIFEKWLKRVPAEKKGKEIKERFPYQYSHCGRCGSSYLFRRTLNNFIIPYNGYWCMDCGNTQLTDGSDMTFVAYDYAMNKAGIIYDEVNETFRYAIIPTYIKTFCIAFPLAIIGLIMILITIS